MFRNYTKMTTATTGTGTITLGSAVSPFLSFADAGVKDGERVSYMIIDGSNFELGEGKYTSSGTTLSRLRVEKSSNSNNKITLSGSAEVYITIDAEMIRAYDPSDRYIFEEEFASGSSETGEIGDNNWSFSAGTNFFLTNVEENHPGVLVRSYNSISSTIYIGCFYANLAYPDIDDMTWILKFDEVTVDNTWNIQFGLSNAPGSNVPTYGIYFEKLWGDDHIYAVCRDNGTQTRSAAIMAMDINVWHRFHVRRVSASSFGFSVDGGTEEVISTNVPTTVGTNIFGVPTVKNWNISGSVTRYIYMDYVRVRTRKLNR